MEELQKIKEEIDQIKKRNSRVEADKAWETSLFRKVLIAALTYVVVVLFFSCQPPEAICQRDRPDGGICPFDAFDPILQKILDKISYEK